LRPRKDLKSLWIPIAKAQKVLYFNGGQLVHVSMPESSTTSEEVMESNSTIVETAAEVVTIYGLKIIGAIIILVVGFIVARIIANVVKRMVGKSEKMDPGVQMILVKLTRITIVAFAIYASISAVGVETTGLVALIGAAGLAIGLSLQGTLTNVASGVMMMIFRPFTIGHVINVGGDVYIIDEIGLFITKAHIPDGPSVIIPNAKIWGNTITNLSLTFEDRRRVNETIGISYADDIDKAIQIIKDIIAEDEMFLKDPEPMVAVTKLNDSSVDLLVFAWTKRADWFPTRLAFIKKVKQTFDEKGVSIPFPQRDVHLFQQKEA